MNRYDDKDRFLVTSKSLAGARPVIINGGEITKQYSEIKRIFSNEKAYRLFAEPVFFQSGGQTLVDWLTEYEGNAVSFDRLDEKRQEEVKWKLKEQIHLLRQETDHMESISEKNSLLKLIEAAIEIPSLSDIYLIGDNIVLTRWGFTADEFKPQKGLVLKIIKERPLTTMPLRVIDSDNYPAIDINLQISYGDDNQAGHTDHTGMAIFPNIPVKSDVSIEVELPNGDIFEKHVICEEDEKEYLIVLPGSLFRPKYKMNFNVIDSGNLPCKHLNLIIHYDNIQEDRITDDKGQAIVDEVPEKMSVKAIVNLPDQNVFEADFICENDNEVYTISLPVSLTPKSTMKFRVIDSKRNAIEGLSLKLAYDGTNYASRQTNSEGMAVFSDIPVGEKVQLETPSNKGKKRIIKFTCEAQETLHEIMIKPAFNWKKLLLIFLFILLVVLAFWLLRRCNAPPPEISKSSMDIMVIDKATRQPISDADVSLKYSGEYVHFKTDTNGRVKFSNIPNSASLVLFSKKQGYMDESVVVICCPDVKLEIEMSSLQPDAINKSLDILVIDKHSGRAISEADIQIEYLNHSLNKKTGMTGDARFEDIKQGQTIKLYAKKSGYGDKQITFGCCPSEKKVIELTIGQGKASELKVYLRWMTDDDVDLEVIDPCGNKITHGGKRKCEKPEGIIAEGINDVDTNARSESNKRKKCDDINSPNCPDENIYWKPITPEGEFKIQVQLHTKRSSTPVKYWVTITVNGVDEEFTGELVKEDQVDVIKTLHIGN